MTDGIATVTANVRTHLDSYVNAGTGISAVTSRFGELTILTTVSRGITLIYIVGAAFPTSARDTNALVTAINAARRTVSGTGPMEVSVVTVAHPTEAVRNAFAGSIGVETDAVRTLRAFDLFATELPMTDACVCARHSIASAAERAGLVASRFDIAGLPRISKNDPQVVWIGGRSGDLIRIDRSLPSGPSITYRPCI
jgi:DNA-directed RNA polymerase subunit H (RpoH/RPB5)